MASPSRDDDDDDLKARLYDAYQDSKEDFDKAEMDFQAANEAYETARQVRSQKQIALQASKEHMDDAYDQWTRGANRGEPHLQERPVARHIKGNDTNKTCGGEMISPRNKRKHEESYEDEKQQQRRSSYDDRDHRQETERSASPRGYGAPAVDVRQETNPSIFIPFVHTNITEQRIKDAIERQGWGIVSHVDLVALTPRPGKPPINRAYIHLNWNVQAEDQRQEYLRLKPGGHVPLVYDEPWFWKTMPNKPPAAQRALQQEANQSAASSGQGHQHGSSSSSSHGGGGHHGGSSGNGGYQQQRGSQSQGPRGTSYQNSRYQNSHQQQSSNYRR
jgi:hypothetical protein